MTLKIINGHLLTKTGELIKQSLLIKDGKIAEISKEINSKADYTIDAKGKLVSPGFIDLHVHLREPGGEEKETIATGTMAAAKGGFTTVAAMPNTNPVPDNVEQMNFLQERIEKTANVRVLPYGSITKGLAGEQLTDFNGLKSAGAFAFTDDGVGVQCAAVMLRAMEQAVKADVAIVAHCEENSLINDGSFHEGKFSKRNNLNGIPSICESVQIARDVLLAEATNCHYHVCHISTEQSVRVVRDAKRAGINVTAEVTPHHLLLCEDDIPNIDSNYKMNPPLRSSKDRDALIEGLLDGTIDFIATDHAPHTEADKSLPIEDAPFGIVGLETAFPLLYTNLVKKGIISLHDLISKLTNKPAEIFKLPYGKIGVGEIADLTLIDLEKEAIINPNEFVSKSKNTPFTNWHCYGWPVMTIVGGEILWEAKDN